MTGVSYVYSAQVVGLKTHIVTTEVDLFGGIHTFSIVGLPDKAVEESRDRVSSAIKSAGFESPKSGQKKIVASLSPADLKKEGPLFDLPIALGYLLTTKKVAFNPQGRLFIGELSLSGNLLPIKGALVIAQAAKEAGFKEIYLPQANAQEASLVSGIDVYGAETLSHILGHLDETQRNTPTSKTKLLTPEKKTRIKKGQKKHTLTFGDIKGQATAKRGLQIAAAGGHNIAFYGPPGSGKTLLARALTSILPPLSFNESMEVTGIHSLSGTLDSFFITDPPFRAPHHTSSYTSVIGGGTYPKPGEVTLAHNGVLFLDEFPEFDRRVIESLRQPLEENMVAISRSKGTEVFPASFILIAALNPCPCGFYGDNVRECTCAPSQLSRYQRKISGPIIDRIDMWIEVSRIDNKELSQSTSKHEIHSQKDDIETKRMRDEVLSARKIQEKRRKRFSGPLNTNISVVELKNMILLDETKETLDNAAKKHDLSARAYHRVIKLGRTIADLSGESEITPHHILEALQYRPKSLFTTNL